ncbi:MAG: hypothetical protein FJ030_19740 [Chloroflexi bacterium]|nr:hypothetical protein [Chloroflexota bacterium]
MIRQRLAAILPIVILFAIGLAAYGSTFGLNFFWEDPFDIGQVDSLSYSQLLFAPHSNSYYRPLTLGLMKILSGGQTHSPAIYHAANIAMHLLAAAAVLGVAHRLLRGRQAPWGVALLFTLYPLAYEATARAVSTYSEFMLLAAAALWLYIEWRERGRRRLIVFSILCMIIAMLFHENGVVIPPFVLILELYLLWQKRVSRFSPAALLFFIPAIAFVLVWLNIPKPAGQPQLDIGLRKALYLSQGLSFPFARLISQTGGWGLPAEWQAGLALILALIVLFALYGRAGRPQLLLALLWWGAATSLVWLARPIEYLVVSPRVMYFPSFAAALAWGGVLRGGEAGWEKIRRAAGGVVVALVAVQSWFTLGASVNLYRAGSALMDQIVAAGQGSGRQLFINVPDRFEYREPLYPLGYWGMLLAPVSQDLSDFVRFSTGVEMETESLSDFPLMAAMADASPYSVNTRGADAHASGAMYEAILWADETYWTDYHPDGSMTLKPVGDVRGAPTTTGLIGRFGQTAELRAAEIHVEQRVVTLTLYWLALEPARPTDTVFVHLVDSNGALAGQGDGDSLGGLLPPSAWRAGHEIVDRRTIVSEAPLPPGRYHINIGMYDRATGERHAALDATGAQTPNGELAAGVVEIP